MLHGLLTRRAAVALSAISAGLLGLLAAAFLIISPPPPPRASSVWNPCYPVLGDADARRWDGDRVLAVGFWGDEVPRHIQFRQQAELERGV